VNPQRCQLATLEFKYKTCKIAKIKGSPNTTNLKNEIHPSQRLWNLHHHSTRFPF
jgi:hypothetical protein